MTQESENAPSGEKNTSHLRRRKPALPLLWRFFAGLGLAGLSVGCFFLILRLSGISAPFISEQNRDTLFFAFLAGMVLYVLMIPAASVLLRGCLEKKPVSVIVKDVIRTMTLTAGQSLVAIIVEALLGSSRTGDKSSSSSGKNTTQGGGGSFGGGGSSGTF